MGTPLKFYLINKGTFSNQRANLYVVSSILTPQAIFCRQISRVDQKKTLCLVYGPVVQRLGYRLVTPKIGVRFSVGPPHIFKDRRTAIDYLKIFRYEEPVFVSSNLTSCSTCRSTQIGIAAKNEFLILSCILLRQANWRSRRPSQACSGMWVRIPPLALMTLHPPQGPYPIKEKCGKGLVNGTNSRCKSDSLLCQQQA